MFVKIGRRAAAFEVDKLQSVLPDAALRYGMKSQPNGDFEPRWSDSLHDLVLFLCLHYLNAASPLNHCILDARWVCLNLGAEARLDDKLELHTNQHQHPQLHSSDCSTSMRLTAF